MVSKQEHNQSLFKGTPTSFPSTLWTTTASGDVMDALTQVLVILNRQVGQMHRLNLSESNEEVSERLSKFEKEIDSVEPDQV